MALHGVKRTNLSEENLEAQRKADTKRINQFRELTEKAFELRTKVSSISPEEELDWKTLTDGLSLCTDILRNNSEFYTIWNLRKKLLRLILSNQSKGDSEKKDLLKRELLFSEDAIKYNYKSYWAWYHRQWLIDVHLQNNYEVTWERELYLCSKLLSLDGRNFHCWSYRRYVRSKIPQTENYSSETEFKFTSNLLETKDSFSNYSAFHQRSLLIPKLNKGDKLVLKTNVENELELLHNAWFTQPNDSSPWFYFLWLMHISELDKDLNRIDTEINLCLDLLSVEPDCKWPILIIVVLSVKKMENNLCKEEEKKDITVKINQHLNSLIKIDKKHKNYYHHLLQISQQ